MYREKPLISPVTHNYVTNSSIFLIATKGRKTMSYRADSRFAYSQWETVLLCNDVFHWLGASLESAMWQICQCSKLLSVRLSEADNFGGKSRTFWKISFNFMFMIWDSRQEDWQHFFYWVLNPGYASVNQDIIGSGTGLLPIWHQVITWNWPRGTKFSEILTKIEFLH